MKRLLILLIVLPIFSYAKDYGCAATGATMEISLFRALSEELNIDISGVNEMQTQVKILDISPVSKVYAEYLARFDYNSDPDKNKTEDKYKHIYFSSYYDNDAKSITAQYTYFKGKKKDVFIATSLMNKDECSIRFNGYITLSREF